MFKVIENLTRHYLVNKRTYTQLQINYNNIKERKKFIWGDSLTFFVQMDLYLFIYTLYHVKEIQTTTKFLKDTKSEGFIEKFLNKDRLVTAE